jgi:hypothetical protein
MMLSRNTVRNMGSSKRAIKLVIRSFRIILMANLGRGLMIFKGSSIHMLKKLLLML